MDFLLNLSLVEAVKLFVGVLFVGTAINLYINYKYRFSSVKGVICNINILFMLLEIVLGFCVCMKLPTLSGDVKTFILYFIVIFVLSKIMAYLNDAPWTFLQYYLFEGKKDKSALSLYVLFGALQHVVCILCVSALAFWVFFGGKSLINWLFK